MVDVGDLYNIRALGDPPVNVNNPATYRRAESTVHLSSNEAAEHCAAWAVQVVQNRDSEFDLWDALSGVETQMESNPGATQQFFTAWRSGAGRSRAERFYHALTALRQQQPQQPPPAPAAPPPFGGPEAFRLLFTSLLDASRADAIACALRRVYPNERMYNDTRSAGLGMFDNDLTVWLSEAVACGKLLREDAMAAAGDERGALALIHRIAGATVPAQPCLTHKGVSVSCENVAISTPLTTLCVPQRCAPNSAPTQAPSPSTQTAVSFDMLLTSISSGLERNRSRRVSSRTAARLRTQRRC